MFLAFLCWKNHERTYEEMLESSAEAVTGMEKELERAEKEKRNGKDTSAEHQGGSCIVDSR